MEERREKFVSTINEEYIAYCKSKGIKPTQKGLCHFMLNKNIINDITVNRFLVISQYPSLLCKNMGIKKLAVYNLEDLTGLKTRSINYIIKRFSTHFRLNKS